MHQTGLCCATSLDVAVVGALSFVLNADASAKKVLIQQQQTLYTMLKVLELAKVLTKKSDFCYRSLC